MYHHHHHNHHRHHHHRRHHHPRNYYESQPFLPFLLPSSWLSFLPSQVIWNDIMKFILPLNTGFSFEFRYVPVLLYQFGSNGAKQGLLHQISPDSTGGREALRCSELQADSDGGWRIPCLQICKENPCYPGRPRIVKTERCISIYQHDTGCLIMEHLHLSLGHMQADVRRSIEAPIWL
jgi:hypothetical protein